MQNGLVTTIMTYHVRSRTVAEVFVGELTAYRQQMREIVVRQTSGDEDFGQ